MDIAVEKRLSVDKLCEFVKTLFPTITIVCSQSLDDLGREKQDVFILVEYEKVLKFTTQLTIYFMNSSESYTSNFLCLIAMEISHYFKTETLCDGSLFAKSKAPYYCLLWSGKTVLLVDDSRLDCDSHEPELVVLEKLDYLEVVARLKSFLSSEKKLRSPE